MSTRLSRGLWSCALLALVFGLFAGLLPSAAWAAEAAHGHGEELHGFQNSKPVAFLFWILAAGALGGSLFVITRRNMVAAVMGMVGTFFAIAGLYLMLYASFLAVMQVLVYAGAIMVLFVFVIMILNKEEDEPWSMEGLLGKGLAGAGLLYLFVRIAKILWGVRDQAIDLSQKASELQFNRCLAPLSQKVQEAAQMRAPCPEEYARAYDFGSVEGVGYTLFTDYLFPFEAVSIVLLVAVVGTVAVARPSSREQSGGSKESEAEA
jgi:NADH-quinone oxidoreductase subunit J